MEISRHYGNQLYPKFVGDFRISQKTPLTNNEIEEDATFVTRNVRRLTLSARFILPFTFPFFFFYGRGKRVGFSVNVILFNEVAAVSRRDTPELQIYARFVFDTPDTRRLSMVLSL